MIDLKLIIDILNVRKYSDLARLLRDSHYDIEQSSSYGGHHLFSYDGTVNIYSPMEAHEQLKKLSDSDRKALLEALIEIHPGKDYGIDLSDIRFLLDPEAPISATLSQTENLSQIDFSYIREQIQKCSDKISSGDFDGAITNARTLLESVCNYVLDSSKVTYKSEGDLNKLYKQVVQTLNMDPQQYSDKFFKEILSGCFSIVNGLANIRNELGDAHGKSKLKHYKPSKRHALFAVEVSKALSEFLYSSFIDKKGSS